MNKEDVFGVAIGILGTGLLVFIGLHFGWL